MPNLAANVNGVYPSLFRRFHNGVIRFFSDSKYPSSSSSLESLSAFCSSIQRSLNFVYTSGKAQITSKCNTVFPFESVYLSNIFRKTNKNNKNNEPHPLERHI